MVLGGPYLLETVPCVLYILMRHGDDPEEAIVRAVNDTKDNDTIAAIVGAPVGTLYGKEALPRRWREGLLGRTGEDDDGRVFELLEMAEKRWVRNDQGREARSTPGKGRSAYRLLSKFKLHPLRS